MPGNDCYSFTEDEASLVLFYGAWAELNALNGSTFGLDSLCAIT